MGLHMHPNYYLAVGAGQYSIFIFLFHLEQLENENCVYTIFLYIFTT